MNGILGFHRIAEDDRRQSVGAIEMPFGQRAELLGTADHEAVADTRRQHRRRSLTLRLPSLFT